MRGNRQMGRPPGALYAGLFLLAAATLIFEIALTRLFSLTQGYHFAFLSVSIALLGAGASGSLLAWRPGWRDRRHSLTAAAVSMAGTLAGGHLLLKALPFDTYRLALESVQWVYLVACYLLLVAPFLVGGLVMALALARWSDRAPALYAANMAGAAAGCLAVLILLPLLGGEGTVWATALLAWCAAGLLRRAEPGRIRRRTLLVYLGGVALLAGVLVARPPALEWSLSPYKALSYALRYPDARLRYRAWDAGGRVDVVESSAIRSAPGLSLASPALPPAQLGLTVDGDNLSPITAGAGDLSFLDYRPTALPYLLRPTAQALILAPRGGLEVWQARRGGAATITVVEPNALVVQAVRDEFAAFSGGLYRAAGVTVQTTGVRSALASQPELFDIVQVALTDSYRPVLVGSYGLGEDYTLTIEGVTACLARLRPTGLFVAQRWLQQPPSEEMRLFALVLAAGERAGWPDIGAHLVAIRDWSTLTVLACPTPFSPADLAAVREFCAARRFDLVWSADLRPDEVNRYNRLTEPVYEELAARLVDPTRRDIALHTAAYALTSPTDDRPFFHHYFKWNQVPAILSTLGRTWQPFGGSGYLILVAALGLSLAASGVLIVGPLVAVRRGNPAGEEARMGKVAPGAPCGRRFEQLFSSTDTDQIGQVPCRWMAYFALLGGGYLLAELALMQRFILFLDHPTFAFALVLGALLFYSGLGSLVAARLPLRPLLAALVVVLMVAVGGWGLTFQALLGWPLWARLLAAALILAPLGVLMGMPFPAGLRRAAGQHPGIVPWAWAINGCASVVSAVVATMLALEAGFTAVLGLAILCYALAGLMPGRRELVIAPASGGQRHSHLC